MLQQTIASLVELDRVGSSETPSPLSAAHTGKQGSTFWVLTHEIPPGAG